MSADHLRESVIELESDQLFTYWAPTTSGAPLRILSSLSGTREDKLTSLQNGQRK